MEEETKSQKNIFRLIHIVISFFLFILCLKKVEFAISMTLLMKIFSLASSGSFFVGYLVLFIEIAKVVVLYLIIHLFTAFIIQLIRNSYNEKNNLMTTSPKRLYICINISYLVILIYGILRVYMS